MIKANELMLGNFVDTPDGTVKITAISYEKVAVIRKTEKGNFAVYSESLDDIKPIPLSEDILLKCGFEKRDYNEFRHVELIGTLTLYDGVCEIHLGDLYSAWIESIHKLQNIYYALTSEELEVNL